MLSVLRLFYCLTLVLIVMTSCSTNPMNGGDPTDEFWFRNPDLRAVAEQRMESARMKLHTIQDVKNLQSQFTWILEIEEFEPTIEIVFARNLVGSCKSAAVLGQWSLAQIGIESRFVELSGNNVESHIIVISYNNTIMISNNEVVTGLDSELWQNQVLSLFGWKYTRIE